jgi:hypothetical protein
MTVKNFVNITYFVHRTTVDNEKELASGWKPSWKYKLEE